MKSLPSHMTIKLTTVPILTNQRLNELNLFYLLIAIQIKNQLSPNSKSCFIRFYYNQRSYIDLLDIE